jgi:FHS family Na+ dependent glucose MFS transporter 1
MHTQIGEISLLFAVRPLGYLIGSVQSGLLYDRYRGHPILSAALIACAVLMTLVPLTTLLGLLIVIFLCLGVAEGLLDVGGNTLLVWVHGERVGPYMNGLHFCFGAGALLAPIVVAQVVLGGWPSLWAYWVLAALFVPPVLVLLRFPSPAVQHSAETDKVVLINYRLVLLIALFFMLYTGAEVGFGGWVFSYAAALELTDPATAAYLTSAFWGALTAGRLLAIPLAARLRPRTMLLGDLLGCLISVGGMVVWSHSLTALWLGAIGLGLSMASVFPTTLSFAARRMRTTGKVTSWFLVGASVGVTLLPWLIGQLFGTIGPQITMRVILIDLLAACVIFVLLMRTADRPTTNDQRPTIVSAEDRR